MSDKQNVRETIEGLRQIPTPEQPYTGEIKAPEHLLDAMILDTISQFGADPVPPVSPYVPKGYSHESSVYPDTVIKDEHDEYHFGANYLTKHFDISDHVKLIVAYNKKGRLKMPGIPEVVIDHLKPEGGIDRRVLFSGSFSEEQTILKSMITRFGPTRSTGSFTALYGEKDFSRPLRPVEKRCLQQLLAHPDDENALEIAKGLSTINDNEKELTQKNRAEAEKREQESQARIEKNRGGGFIVTSAQPKRG